MDTFQTYWVVSWLKRLDEDHSSRRHGLEPNSVHVGFVVDKVAPVQVFLRVLRFFPASTIPSLRHSQLHLHVAVQLGETWYSFTKQRSFENWI